MALIGSLEKRVHGSRSLKLRCLLLLKHPAFSFVRVALRYSSAAFEKRLQRRNMARNGMGMKVAGSHSREDYTVTVYVDMVIFTVLFGADI